MNLIKRIHRKIPLIVKRIAFTCAAISIAIGGYGLAANNDTFIKIGGYCTIISAGLPPLFGLGKEEPKIND
jgi:hypothetical protein